MTLVDTSVWIEVFRLRNPLDLERLVPFDEVVTCLPVIQEVLQGFRDDNAYHLAREAMSALPLVESPIGADCVHTAIDLYRVARRKGITIRSSVECLIAACAIRHQLEVLHIDRDYRALSKISDLRSRPARQTNSPTLHSL